MGIGELTGRELEALVAEQLFGLEVEERTNSRLHVAYGTSTMLRPMDEAYQVILAWLDKEFPSGAYLSEHWSKDDASAYMPMGWSLPPELAHEPVEVFAKRNAPPPAPRRELVVVRRALEESGPSVIVASLRSQGVAKRLRKAPAVRLLLDRALMIRPWGRSSTGGAADAGGART